MPPLYVAGDDELEFHLATLLVDLRALSSMAEGMGRDPWLSTVQPMIAHAAGVCFAIASITQGETARVANELAQEVGSVMPPEEGAERASNEDAWKAIADKHRELVATLPATTKIRPWVRGKEQQ